MRVRTPGTSFLQRHMAKFTTIRPEESVTRSGNTASENRNISNAMGDCEATQIGRNREDIGDCDIARGTLAATNDASIYFGYNRR